MPEREANRKILLSVEDLKQEFHSHLLSVEFGSPDYNAFCDFFALENQRHLQIIEAKNLMGDLMPKERLSAESELRITETRIAILESEIERKQIADIKYSKSYSNVEAKMEELRNVISNEIESRRPTSSKDSKEREKSEVYWDTLVNDFRDVLYRFYL